MRTPAGVNSCHASFMNEWCTAFWMIMRHAITQLWHAFAAHQQGALNEIFQSEGLEVTAAHSSCADSSLFVRLTVAACAGLDLR